MLLFLSSCETTGEKDVQPSNDPSASARRGAGTLMNPPADGCPDGYYWNGSQCVREQVTYPDLATSTITYNTAAATTYPYQSGSSLSVKITPGSTINGVSYYKGELYRDGISLNDRVIFGIRRSPTVTTTFFTNYYDINGLYIGKLTVINNNQFGSYSPGYTGSVGGTGWNSRGFIGQWGKCVGQTLSYFGNGTALGAVAGLGCLVWGPQCAGWIGLGCVAAVVLS
jgi:hypothetical protein